MKRWLSVAYIVGTLLLVIPAKPPADSASDFFPNTPPDEAYYQNFIECTTGLASGAATPDGRPLLWKNRDLGGGQDQEFHYYDDGRIPFISLTYSGETDEYYGGINAEGFAVENSNSYNLPPGPYSNGWGSSPDDGFIHTLALATCRTIDDFQHLLDSTNVGGRMQSSNYGAIDAYGGAAMFETGGYSYVRCDASEAPGGFLVRSNYSYSGRDVNNRDYSWGPHRHDASFARFKFATEHNELTPLYIFQQVARDISVPGLDNPYPLPYNGYFDSYPFGCIPNGEAVCRSTTRGVLVAQGVRAGERPDDAILWAMVGSQLSCVASPLWVRAGSVPEEFNGAFGSRICDRAKTLSNYVYTNGNGVLTNGVVNTWHLTNSQGTGLWDFTLPLEQWVYNKTQQFVHSPQFSYDRLTSFQNEMAQQVADSLEAWRPNVSVTNIADPILLRGHIILHWGQPDAHGLVTGNPRQYRVYRSAEPFRNGNSGELLATVERTDFVDENPPLGTCFYQIEGTYK